MRLSSVREAIVESGVAGADVIKPTTRRNEMSHQLSGVAIAAAAAALFAAGTFVAPTVSAAEGSPVHCAGINSCKGSSECKTAKSECKGMNACKGQGWVVKASAKECTDAGGKVVK
jgi:hypothetical protein